MNETKAKIEIEKCLNEMYKASTPSITWAQVKKRYGNTKTRFFLKHYLPKSKFEKIRKKYVSKLGRRWRRDLEWCLLDYSPTTVEREVD